MTINCYYVCVSLEAPMRSHNWVEIPASHTVFCPKAQRQPIRPLLLPLRQTLEKCLNEDRHFSQKLIACKLRSPPHDCVPVDVKRHGCFFCGKQFNDKFDLKRHTRTHTGKKSVQMVAFRLKFSLPFCYSLYENDISVTG